MAARTDIRMSLSSSYCFLTRRNARTTEGFPKASSNFIAPAHVIRDLHQGLHLSCRRCLIFLVCPLCANRNESSGSLALASCHIQTRSGLCGFVSAECSPMLLAGEQAPLSSPRRRHNGHGRTCHWFGPVANGPKRSFCLEQTSCEQFDIASDQSPMVSVTGRGGYCHECRQKTLARQGKERVFG